MQSSQLRWTTAVVLGGALVALLSLSPKKEPPSLKPDSKAQTGLLAQVHKQPATGPEAPAQVDESVPSDMAQRRAAFRDLIISSPKKALAEAISFEAYQQLSAEEKQHHETPIRGRSRIETQITCFGSRPSEVSYFVQHEGKELRVYGLTDYHQGEVEFVGVAVDGVAALRVEAASTQTNPSVSAATAVAAATRKVLVVPVNLSDKKLTFSKAAIEEGFHIAQSFIEENSRYRLTIETTIADAVDLPGTAATFEANQDSYFTLYDDAIKAVQAGGKYSTANYDTVAVLFPLLSYDFGGRASAPGRKLWLNGTVNWSTIAHELGHNLGLGHARFLQPKSKDDLLSDVTVVEYGNYMDVMGSGYVFNSHFGAGSKDTLHWLDANEVVTVSTSGTYRISAHDNTTTGTGHRALKLRKKGSTETAYYIELRGRNVNVTRAAGKGLGTGWISELVDNEPLSGDPYDEPRDSALVAGNLFRDPTNDLYVVVKEVSADEQDRWADVVVHIGAPPDSEVPTISQISATDNKVPSINTLTAHVNDAGGRPSYIKWKIDGLDPRLFSSSTLSLNTAIGGQMRVTATPTDGFRQGSPLTYEFTLTDPLLSWTRVRSSSSDIATANGRLFQGNETTSDGITWTKINAPDGAWLSFKAVAYLNGQYVGVTDFWDSITLRTRVLTSPDGITWTKRYDASVVKSPARLVATANTFVIADSENHLLVGDSSFSFEEVTPGGIAQVTDAAAFNGKFYLLSSSRDVHTSVDGKTWTNTYPSIGTYAWGFYTDGEYLMKVASPGTIAQIAKDGVLTYSTTNSTDFSQSPPWANSFPQRLVSVWEGNLTASLDGIEWATVPRQFGYPFSLSGKPPLYFNGRAYSVGSDGLYRSDLLIPSPSVTQNEKNYTLRVGKTYQIPVTPTVQSADLRAQWFKDGIALAGQTSLTLSLSISEDSAGRYSVQLTNAAGSTTVNVATITTSDQPAGRLVNLSVRGLAGTGENMLIAGFIISGADSDAMPLLIRGIGPSLKEYDVTSPISHAALTLFDRTGTAIRSNSSWGGHWVLRDAMKRLEAFELDNASRDAATYELLDHPLYTVGATPVDGVAGEALLELYEDTDVLTGAALVNISARGSISKDAPMIAGFIIAGDAPVTVLIRGIGPTLTSFDVNAAAEDTVLQVFDGTGTPIDGAYNDDWANNGEASLRDAFKATDAFELDAMSKDAALLVTLNPGLYTVHLTSKTSEPAIGLIEVYRRN